MIKKVSILIFLFISFIISTNIKSNYNIYAQESEHKLTTAKNPTGVKHFGTSNNVMIPNEYNQTESQMRGVWVATVYNIAISKQNGLSIEAIENYKKEFNEILDRMEEFGMNTIFFQVRPCNDAFYQSNLNPWSKFLVGEGINPNWDPLSWMIDETHKRGFRFVCWMNAFRVTTESYVTTGKAINSSIAELVKMKHNALGKLADNNFAKLHPEYVLAGLYDEKLILNPSEPAVQKFIVDTIMEIVENYNVDGLHFDDYFYLEGYNSSNTENTNFVGYNSYLTVGKDIMNDVPNYLEYQKDPKNYGIDVFGDDGIYGMPSGLNLGDFRRENINNLMRNIRKKIDEYNLINKTNVEFGTKPAAVWRSNSQYCTIGSTRCAPNGSNTDEGAYSTYNDLYADSLKWVQEGLVDWVAPQVYYSFEDAYAPYADVVDWWVEQVRIVNEKRRMENKKDINLYIAHGIYKYRDNPEQFYRANEIIDQLKYNNKYRDVIKGSAVYSYELLYKTLGSNIVGEYPNAENIRNNAMKYFKNLWSNNQVFPLTIGDYDASNLLVEDYNLKENSMGIVSLQFDTLKGASAYGFYMIPKNTPFEISNLEYRKKVIYSGYEDSKKVCIELEDLDYDYYIVPISVNGHISEHITKLDLSKITKNKAPNKVEISLELKNDNELLSGAILNGYFPVPTDDDGDLVEYTFSLMERNRKRKIDVETKIIDNMVYFSWQSFYYLLENTYIIVDLTDNDLTTECNSKKFSLVNNYSPSPIEITIKQNSYQGLSNLEIEYTEILYATNIKVYFVKDGNKIDITKEFKESSSEGKFTIVLPDEDINEGYIEFILSNGKKEISCKSNVFKVEKRPPSPIEITIKQNSYQGLSNLEIEYTEILYATNIKVYFVKDGNKIDITEEFKESSSEGKFTIVLPDEDINEGYIEFILSNGKKEISCKSNVFKVEKKVVIENSQLPPKKKNCKKTNIIITSILIFTMSISIYYIKNRKN